MSKFIADNGLLDSYQSGFRERYSTHTALINIIDDVKSAIDTEEIVLLVAIDFTKAFDMLNVNLLADKLRALGFSDPACEWVRSFLSNRWQVVGAQSGETSPPILRNCGVPQGSILGPLLFSLSINDAPTVLKHCKHHLYADDFTIYIRGPFNEMISMIEKVNADLHRLGTWATVNGLKINASKTQAIWLGSRGFMSRVRALTLPHLALDNDVISYKECVTVLGIKIDNSLTWSQQCIVTAKKCFAALSRLRKCSAYIPRNTKLMLVKTLVFPYLDYCAGLFLDLSAELILKLQRCKNAAVRFATGTRKYEHITPIYAENNILSFSARRDYLVIRLLANILKYGEPIVLANQLSFRSPNKIGSKRGSQYDVTVPWARTSTFQHSFLVGAATLWNNLPVDVRACYKRPSFKCVLERHFLYRLYKS